MRQMPFCNPLSKNQNGLNGQYGELEQPPAVPAEALIGSMLNCFPGRALFTQS